MKLIIATIIALLPSLALAQPLPQPRPPSGSCPHGYSSSGSFCVPRQGAQEAIPLPRTAPAQRAGPVAAAIACAVAVGADLLAMAEPGCHVVSAGSGEMTLTVRQRRVSSILRAQRGKHESVQ
jgi:hypothetical protein